MPAPSVATYSAAALAAAHTAFRNLIDSGGAAGFIRVRDAADVLLAQVPLAYPCGTVSGSTGQLVLTAAGADPEADADGNAAYGEICDSTGAVHLALPAQEGATPVPGKMVMNSLAVIAGGPVAVLLATIG